VLFCTFPCIVLRYLVSQIIELLFKRRKKEIEKEQTKIREGKRRRLDII
jgi:hypothetical protein